MLNKTLLILQIFFLSASFVPAHGSDVMLEKFFYATLTGDLKSMKRMLEVDKNLAVKIDEFGFQAIHVTDIFNTREVVNLLVKFGANVNAQNDEGYAPLHILIDAEFFPVFQDRGAILDLKSNKGETPLIIQAKGPDSYEILLALLSAGADVHARDTYGNTALYYAKLRGDVDNIELLSKWSTK